MMVLSIPESISKPIPVLHGNQLEPGQEYLCTNAFTGHMLLARWPVIKDGEKWSCRYLLKAYSIEFDPFDPNEDWNNKDIWLHRGGGFGDLLMLTPLIRELRRRWPKAWIHVGCGEQYQPALGGLDVIIESIPIPYRKDVRIDGLIDLEEVVEGDPKAEKLHMAQLFASRAGITLTDLTPEYHVTPDELEWVNRFYPDDGSPRIGIQFLASGFYRTYPKIGEVMMQLSKSARVFLFGLPGQIELKEKIPNVTNLMEHKLSFRQSAAIASTCTACVSPDSVLIHLCSALDVPCVGLYGPFPSDLRVTSDKCFAFNGKAPCAPCFFHAESSDEFPVGMPCSKTKKCIALDSIDPGEIVQKVLSMCTNKIENPSTQ